MQPTDARLLSGVREALKNAASIDPTSKSAAFIAAAIVGVDELILRSDTEFFSAYYRQGVDLERAGQNLRQSSRTAVTHDPFRDLSPELDLERSTARRYAQIGALRASLSEAVAYLTSIVPRDLEVKRYLARVVDWENELHARRLQQTAASISAGNASGAAFTKEAVQAYLNSRFPSWGTVIVTELTRLPGGFSKTTVLVNLDATAIGRRSLVIRAEQAVTLVFFDGAQVENEYRILRLLHRAGRRVAEPLLLEADVSHFGVKFLVSEQAEGRNIGTAVHVHEEVSEELLRELVANLYIVHQTKIDPRDQDVIQSHLSRWRRFDTLSASIKENVADWRNHIDLMKLPASPLMIRALNWLDDNVPEDDDAPSLIHRDFGLHNILVQDGHLSCILDWEGATIGDPAEDLAWMTDSMRSRVDRQQVLDWYAEANGRRIPTSRLLFFDVFTSLKYAVMCAQALSLFENNEFVSVSACQLGFLYPYHGTADLNRRIEAAETQIGRPSIPVDAP